MRDENDNLVFECAANFNAEYIVTHNVRDFRDPELRAYAIAPIRPFEFLRLIEEEP